MRHKGGRGPVVRVAGFNNTVVQSVGTPPWIGGLLAVPPDLTGSRARTLGRADSTLEFELPLELKARVRETSRQALRWFERVINPDHGFPSDDSGTPSCGWATSGVAWAACAAMSPQPRWAASTLQWVMSSTNQDGGVPLALKGTESVLDATAMAVLAMAVDGAEGHQKEIASLARFLSHSQSEGGAWSWIPRNHADSTISTAFAVLALARIVAASEDEADVDRVRQGLAFMASIQNDDGGLPLAPGGPSTAASTGIGLFVFAALDLPGRESLREFLIAEFHRSGWSDVVERPHGHTVIRAGLPYALCGLLADGHREAGTVVVGGLQRLLDEAPGGVRALPGAPGTRTWPTRDLVLALNLANANR